ncbi:hypothetical protein [Halalkalicoccus salilacus]|uniref:hypothetical protein n=1 Tax=Halalkalicoccus salilacus TaxID=3117459 RepID=UPI00300F48AA
MSSDQSQIEDIVEKLQGKKNATRRNLDSFGTLSDINVAFSDILLLFASLMAFVFLGNIVPEGRNWAIFALATSCLLVAGVLIGIYLSPPGMSLYKWLKCKVGFRFGSDHRSAHNADSGRITKDTTSTNGERRAFEDLTRVDGFAPQADAVWRFDGALIGGCEIDPAELTLASKADWEAAADELGNVINSLEHSGQLRNGSVKIDTEAVKRMFGERMGDSDVRSNPQLQQNVAMYKHQLPAQMESRSASIRGFQFLAPVTMEEVQMQGHRVLGRMNELPVIGSGIASMLASRDLTVAEIRYRQERVMKERRASLEKDLSGITGCDADGLSMDDLINVLEESWTGERVVAEKRDDRSLPLVTMTREYTETQGDTRSPDQLAEDELDQQILDELQKSAVPVEDTPESEPEMEIDEDNLIEEDSGQDSEPEQSQPEEQEQKQPQEPERPSMPARHRGDTGATPEAETASEETAPSVDAEQYESLEEVCAALVEQREAAGSEHSGEENEQTDSDTEQQEATT